MSGDTASGEGTADPSLSGERVDTSPVRATLAVQPPPDSGCAITEEKNVSVQEQNLTFDTTEANPTPEQGRCNINVVDTENGEHTDQYVQSEVEEECFCLVFHRVDCIPTFERVQEHDVIVSVLVPDRETLRHLVDQLRRTGAGVRVCNITQPEAEEDASIVMDVTDVTEKQLEALEAAIDAGYYDTPRRADLGQLADRLDISKSAVSQRLNAIESTLVRKLGEKWSER